MANLRSMDLRGLPRVRPMFLGVCPTWRTCPTFFGDSNNADGISLLTIGVSVNPKKVGQVGKVGLDQ